MTVKRLLRALLLFVPAAACGQDPVRLLSWEDCVALAGQRNPSLLSTRDALLATQARYRGSYNALLPNLTLSKRYSDSDSATGASRWQADGSASISLFNWGNYARISGASASFERAGADYRLQSAELRLGLRSAFANLLFTQEQIAVAQRIYDMRRRNSDLVSLKYDSGRESKGNMLRATAELFSANAQLKQAERDLRVARQELNRQLGLDDFEAVAATGTLGVRPLPGFPEPSAAVAANPTVLQREASVDAARASLRESWSSALPTLSASYSKSLRGRDYFPSIPSWGASAVLSYPLFGGGPTATYFGVAAARRDLARARQDLRAARNQVRIGIETAWSQLAQNVDQLEVQRLFLEAARQRNEESSVRYASGLMSFENWEIVVTELVNSERNFIRSRLNAVISEAQWDRSLGLPLEERL